MTREELNVTNGNGVESEPSRRIPVLPSLITLGSTLCGFGSMCLAARSGSPEERIVWFTYAAWIIILAMVFDALDGQVARLTKQTSDFGGHLDSLSDVISFGLAPAFLAWQVIKFSCSFPPPFEWVERVVWLICALYVVFAALRLARFDTSNSHEESAHRFSVGLPSPPAAGMVAGMVMIYTALPEDSTWTHVMGTYIIPLVVLIVGPLMMSKLRYVHLLNEVFKNRRSFPFFVWLIIVVSFLVVVLGKFFVPLVFCAYVASGIIGLAVDKVLDRLDIPEDRWSFFR